jgi:hypothetical protein
MKISRVCASARQTTSASNAASVATFDIAKASRVMEAGSLPRICNMIRRAPEVQTLCDANYVNNAAVKSPDSGLVFLIYPGGFSRFLVYDGTDIQCQTGPGKTSVTITSG